MHADGFVPDVRRKRDGTAAIASPSMPLRIDADRMRADFDALAAFGATPDGGVARTTFSEPHLAVRAWFLERGREAGLEPRVDAAANHSVVLTAPEPGARTLLLGSHLDSVRRGGRYDGALGVCARSKSSGA